MAAEDAIATTLVRTNIGSHSIAADTRNASAPTARMRAAAWLVGQPLAFTKETTRGEMSRPTLPAPATAALANAPASYQRTAMSNRNVLPAVSIMPALAARHNS